MSKLSQFILFLPTYEYKQILSHFIAPVIISENFITVFKQYVFKKSLITENSNLYEPIEWLEKEAEEYCTPDINDGYVFENHTVTKKLKQ